MRGDRDEQTAGRMSGKTFAVADPLGRPFSQNAKDDNLL